MFTEWWDLDEPCAKGEVEAVILSHTYAKTLGEQVRTISFSIIVQDNYKIQVHLESLGSFHPQRDLYGLCDTY